MESHAFSLQGELLLMPLLMLVNVYFNNDVYRYHDIIY